MNLDIDLELKNFIEEYIDLMEEGKWDIIYIDIDPRICGQFTKLMLDIGQNPLEGMDEIPEDFLRGQNVKSFNIPSTIKKISANAFFNSQLESVIIPDGVHTISSGAFEHNKQLRYVELPTSIQQLQPYCFADCVNLEKIVCRGTRYQFRQNLTASMDAFVNTSKTVECTDGSVFILNGNVYDVEGT